jgi:PST family polysaccharide transporter
VRTGDGDAVTDDGPAEPLGSLARASASGAMWNGITYGLSKGLVLVSTVVLARLLVPDDFGLVGIGLLVLGYLEVVNDFGVSAAVIQRRDDHLRTADVAFWTNMILGTFLTVTGVAIAPLIADFFQDDRATAIIQVLSLTFLVSSVGAIHESRLRRELAFRRRTAPELAKGLVKGAVAISFAAGGAGAWSLVWAQMASAVVGSLMYWRALPWRPRRRWDGTIARSLLGYGSQITLVGLLGAVLRNVDYILVGRWLGTRALGLYTLAFRLPQLVVEGVATIVGQVVFPAFSRLQDEPARMRAALARVLTITSLLIAPLGIGIALIADPFVRVFYGERWAPAITTMQLLSLYMVVQSASRNVGDLYKAIGRPGILTGLAVVKLAFTVPALIIAVPHGIVAVAATQVGAAVLATAIDLVVATRRVGLRARDVVAIFAPAARATTVMTLACVGTAMLLDGRRPAIALVGIVVVGVVAYCGALWTLDRERARELVSLFRRAPSHGGSSNGSSSNGGSAAYGPSVPRPFTPEEAPHA